MRFVSLVFVLVAGPLITLAQGQQDSSIKPSFASVSQSARRRVCFSGAWLRVRDDWSSSTPSRFI
jgi:hypothetical protein